jgi:NADPH-dependent stearoyl-CoA 9-desaturase
VLRDALLSFLSISAGVRVYFGSSEEPRPSRRPPRSAGHLLAIADIAAYAHLSPADIEALGYKLDAIRRDIEESLGEKDAAYILCTIRFQRTLDVVARLLIGVTGRLGRGDRVAGLREMCREHGDWPQREPWPMGLDERPGNWEWDVVAVSSRWRYSHNDRHHMFSNVVGVDDDLGFGVMRVTRDVSWQPSRLLQPLRNLLLASIFDWRAWGPSERDRVASDAGRVAQARVALIGKIARQAAKGCVRSPRR